MCSSAQKTHRDLLIHQGGLRSHPLCKLACQILRWTQGRLLSLRVAYILGFHNIGADILSRQGLRPGEWRFGGSLASPKWTCLRLKRRLTVHSGFPHTSSSSLTGRNGTDVAEASSVCLSPYRSAPGSTGESSPGPGSTTSHCPRLAGQSTVPRNNIPPRQASSGAPPSGGTFCPKWGARYFTPSQNCGNGGLGLWGGPAHRLPSQGNVMPWSGVFTYWCSDHQLDTVNCPVGTVLEFLQEWFTAGLARPL